MLIMGLIFGAFVLFARGGLVGVLVRAADRRSSALAPAAQAYDTHPNGPPALVVLDALPPVLDVRGIGHRFGALRVLKDVSLTVAPGERHALIGPNGAGKTTLFNVIAGDLRASEGRVLLGGLDLTRLPAHARTQLGIGRTYQRTSHFHGLSALENVELALRRQRAVASDPFTPATTYAGVRADALQCLHWIGLADRATAPVRSLSYGEQRQLEVAVAWASCARVLLLDEPTAGLSPAETAEMLERLRGLPRVVSLLIIEHDMDVVFALADRITVLQHGEILATGEPHTVRADPAVQEAYLGRLVASTT
jgi:branched-chain amino acid transport system ATP-binding protein